MDEIADVLKYLPQIASFGGLLIAGFIAVIRALSRGDEWQKIVDQKDDDLDRKDREIAARDLIIADLRKQLRTRRTSR